MKKVEEAYGKTAGKSKRYIKIFVTRKRVEASSAQQQSDDSQQQDNTPIAKELINITLQNVDMDDAKQIKETLIPNAKVFLGTVPGKTFKVPVISFQIPEAKFAKWIKRVMPKVQTVFENSNNADYPNVSTLTDDMIEKVHSTPSEYTKEMAQQSIKELEEAVYKAIRENRFDDAMALYKQAINLVARVYGHQLSPNNVKSIYAQATKAGIKPSDKGAATNSYWEDGTEKFWPTFVRSAKSWKNDFGREIKDEPKMQYVILSGARSRNQGDDYRRNLQSQGYNSGKELSLQQRDAAMTKGISYMYNGVGFDISDTEGPNDFFNAPGLLNNLDGTLTDAAKKDNDAWMKQIEALKNDPQAKMSDSDKRREMLSTDKGRAQIFLDAVVKLADTPKYEGGWDNLNINVPTNGEPVQNFVTAINEVAKAKIVSSGWKNPVNVDTIAQMVTAAVCICTVGEDVLNGMNYDFSNVGSIFKSFEECKSTVLSISDSILSALNMATEDEDKKAAMDVVNENKLLKIFNLLERMDNLRDENYKYDISEGLIHRPSDDRIMGYLKKFGLDFSNSTPEINNNGDEEDNSNLNSSI